ncbi:hypothetical protein K7X08_033412 [Anisodus acutangulus]|uniref:Uncharacterized protein n=1 Tax=Anisodus acutangulus TaxID=402998 RepID=A0A9Q1RA30_9SOLA|nr:hypothetical protein K7X08_033412 [Anisodus acutangulus]
MATFSNSTSGQSILRDGMWLIKLVDAKVTKLVSEFPAFVKEAIETALALHTAAFEEVRNEQRKSKHNFNPLSSNWGVLRVVERKYHVLTEPRADHSPKKDDEENGLEKQSEGDPESDIGDDKLESVRSAVRIAGIPRDDMNIVVAMQRSMEELREQRGKSANGASSFSAPHLDVLSLSSVGHVIPLSNNVEPTPSSEVDPIGQTPAPSDPVDADTT